MNKTDLIRAYQARQDRSRDEARADVNAVLDVITETLAKGDPVVITGFGTFTPIQRAARVKKSFGQPPRLMPAYWRVKFRPGTNLQDAVENLPISEQVA